MKLSDWKLKHKKPVPDDVMKLHKSCDIVDLHIDTFMLVRLRGIDITKRGEPPIALNCFRNCVDVPRLREGGVNVPCWGVVVFPFRRDGFFKTAMSYLDTIHDFMQKHPDKLRLALTGGEVEEMARAGEIAGLLGLEGAHPLMGDMAKLDALIDRGIRYLTLTHFSSNEAATCATDRSPKFTGLTDFGRDVVARCNERRVMVDLAHVSKSSFMEAARLSARPVIVSHTGVRGVHDIWRNIDDEQIDAVADSGGVIGIIFQTYFLSPGILCGLDSWADHVDYVIKRVGVDHVAVGSDFDGMIIPPSQIQDVADMPQVTACLVRRGYTEEEIRKILGLNALRVFKEVCG